MSFIYLWHKYAVYAAWCSPADPPHHHCFSSGFWMSWALTNPVLITLPHCMERTSVTGSSKHWAPSPTCSHLGKFAMWDLLVSVKVHSSNVYKLGTYSNTKIIKYSNMPLKSIFIFKMLMLRYLIMSTIWKNWGNPLLSQVSFGSSVTCQFLLA